MNSFYYKAPISNIHPNGHLLIVGPYQSGKKTLAKLLLKKIGSEFSLSIRLSETVNEPPLPPKDPLSFNLKELQNTRLRPRVDLLLIIIDARKPSHLTYLEDQLQLIHYNYLLERCLLVVNFSNKATQLAFDLKLLDTKVLKFTELITLFMESFDVNELEEENCDQLLKKNVIVEQILNRLKKLCLPNIGRSKLLDRCLMDYLA